MVKISVSKLLIIGVLLIWLSTCIQADVIPTSEAHFFKGFVYYNGDFAPVGTIVDAYDPDDVHCGTYTVGVDNKFVPDSVGIYGYMAVYGDDGTTPGIDEGASHGNAISFRIMNLPAVLDSGVNIWNQDRDTSTANISVNTGVVGIDLVDAPNNTTAPACDAGGCDTIRFLIGVQNTGNGIDFYGVNVVSTKGWTVIPLDTLVFEGTDSVRTAFVYNDPDSIAYVFFDVVVPIWPGNEPDTLSYEVFSMLDPSVTVSGSVNMSVTVTDIGDDPSDLLPDQFTLRQNYPNPFNPATNIAFDLTVKTSVRLLIYDILGREVDNFDLGSLSAGGHNFDYDASNNASGIYLYRLVTDYGSQTKKMILAK
ncbi:MAG: T9SS type A sorting domain-containing protein [bacterium]